MILIIFSTASLKAHPVDSCICGEERIKAIEILKNNYLAEVAAHGKTKESYELSKSNEKDLTQKNANLTHGIDLLREALKMEQAKVKTVIEAGFNWLEVTGIGAGVAVLTAVITLLIK